MNFSEISKLLRVQHYVKNILIFFPAFFALKITDTLLFFETFIAFSAFSIAVSGVYIFNDYCDIDQDKKHPIKKNRPLASGLISKKNAVLMIILLLCIGASLMAYISVKGLTVLIIYILLNISYSIYFKEIAIIDVVFVAMGFVLRLFVGSSVSEVGLSMWIVIMTFLLALFIVLAKRRDDVLIFINTKQKVRKSTDGYSLKFLDASMNIIASVLIVAYVMYTTSASVMVRVGSEYLYITSLFVILGIMRYLIITLQDEGSASPIKIIFNDSFLQVVLLLWLMSFTWILY